MNQHDKQALGHEMFSVNLQKKKKKRKQFIAGQDIASTPPLSGLTEKLMLVSCKHGHKQQQKKNISLLLHLKLNFGIKGCDF